MSSATPCDVVYGKFAYESYCIAVDGKSWNGETLKSFKDLPEKIRKAWEFTESCCYKKCFNELMSSIAGKGCNHTLPQV